MVRPTEKTEQPKIAAVDGQDPSKTGDGLGEGVGVQNAA